MRFLALIAALLLLPCANAQTWEVPDARLEEPDDYAQYNNDVLACIDYLEQVPTREGLEKYEQAMGFLMTWLTGAPHVTIEVNEKVLPFLKVKENSIYLVYFLGGWTRYALTDRAGGSDRLQANLAGLRSVVLMHGKLGGKDKEILKLAKMDQGGKLEAWVKKQIKA